VVGFLLESDIRNSQGFPFIIRPKTQHRRQMGHFSARVEISHEHAAGVGREEDEDVPESVQIREVSIAPNGAEEAIVDPAEEAQEKSEERTNPQTNRARVTTSAALVDEDDGGHGTEAHEDEGVDDRVDAGKTGAENGGEENVEAKALAVDGPVGPTVEEPAGNPKRDARHHHPQDG